MICIFRHMTCLVIFGETRVVISASIAVTVTGLAPMAEHWVDKGIFLNLVVLIHQKYVTECIYFISFIYGYIMVN